LKEVDIAVLLVYMFGVVLFGAWFVRRSRTTEQFMAAGRSLPGWAVGLSIFGTYLSSNTFIGLPGKAYGANWNRFVFSLAIPIAAVIAVRWFVPSTVGPARFRPTTIWRSDSARGRARWR